MGHWVVRDSILLLQPTMFEHVVMHLNNPGRNVRAYDAQRLPTILHPSSIRTIVPRADVTAALNGKPHAFLHKFVPAIEKKAANDQGHPCWQQVKCGYCRDSSDEPKEHVGAMYPKTDRSRRAGEPKCYLQRSLDAASQHAHDIMDGLAAMNRPKLSGVALIRKAEATPAKSAPPRIDADLAQKKVAESLRLDPDIAQKMQDFRSGWESDSRWALAQELSRTIPADESRQRGRQYRSVGLPPEELPPPHLRIRAAAAKSAGRVLPALPLAGPSAPQDQLRTRAPSPQAKIQAGQSATHALAPAAKSAGASAVPNEALLRNPLLLMCRRHISNDGMGNIADANCKDQWCVKDHVCKTWWRHMKGGALLPACAHGGEDVTHIDPRTN